MALPVARSLASTVRGFLVESASGGNVQPPPGLAAGAACLAAIAATITTEHRNTSAIHRRFMKLFSCLTPAPLAVASNSCETGPTKMIQFFPDERSPACL